MLDSKNSKYESLIEGNIFGIREDFNGLGIIFDTYDNDGQRDNPTVYVLYNNGSSNVKWDYSNDFRNNHLESVIGLNKCTLKKLLKKKK